MVEVVSLGGRFAIEDLYEDVEVIQDDES
jgi:hypothetical protein